MVEGGVSIFVLRIDPGAAVLDQGANLVCTQGQGLVVLECRLLFLLLKER